MIPKDHRLTRREIDRLFVPQSPSEKSVSPRRVLHTPSFFILAEPSEVFKAGVAVPKKVFKRAVDRNTLRRRVLDALKDIGFLSLPYSILVSVKKGTRLLTKKEVLDELSGLCAKLNSSE